MLKIRNNSWKKIVNSVADGAQSHQYSLETRSGLWYREDVIIYTTFLL